MTNPGAAPPRGLLRRLPEGVVHERLLPPPELAPYVAHTWWLRWALDGPFVAETLPHPCVHLSFESGRAHVRGVLRGRFSRVLEGRGRVFGVKFRPAAFQPWLRASMSTLTDRAAPLESVFGASARALAGAMETAHSHAEALRQLEPFLLARRPELPAELRRIRDLVERMAVDRTLVRVEQAAELLQVDVRALQRRFRRYVGVSPKWAIARYRLHEAAELLGGPSPPTLANVAHELGYSDQSHFARDFRATIGRTPGRFG